MKLRPLILALGCFWFLLSGCSKESDLAPDFTLRLVQDQTKKITLSQLTRTQSVLLVFWATWCDACVSEIPILNAWQSQYADEGLQILAVNVQESREHVTKFQDENPFDFLSVLDSDGQVASLYGLSGLPSSVLLAKGGEIIYYGFGLPERLEPFLAHSTKP